MGILKDLMKELEYAFEADDVTQAAQQGAQNIMGGATTNTNTPRNNNDQGTDNQGGDDISKTDDIFGTQGNQDVTEDTADKTDDNNQNNDEDENNPDGETDPNIDNPGDSDIEEDSKNDRPPYMNKNKLKGNMVQLYNIFKDNVSTLSSLLSQLEDQSSIKVCNSLLRNMTDCKEILYRDLVEKFEKSPYEDLLRDYITIKRVHDLCTEVLSKHFDKISNKK